ncbi:putative protein 2 [Pollicipes pollicipes]|uniref:putative protein 2 n=1 Tax=Pollicipes pollicipes TaxID=41117 RepID=UPI001884EFAD|nr:putative protein 2 [Pollicipes pollicipes]
MHSAAMFSALLIIVASFTIHDTEALYEDVRCKCVCPNPNVVNGSSSDRKLYIANVAPNLCNCDNVILPELPANFSKSREFCPLCECKFESRNTTTIKDELSGRMAQPLYEQGSVLNRVGNRQDRWKRQVQEQRNNIYVRRTMLN